MHPQAFKQRLQDQRLQDVRDRVETLLESLSGPFNPGSVRLGPCSDDREDPREW